MKVSLDGLDLGALVEQALEEEGRRVRSLLTEEAERAAEETVKTLKGTAPVRTGKYRRAIRQKKTSLVAQTPEHTVHTNRPHYRKNHLLEHGHAKVNGGRVPGRPHWAPAEQAAIRNYEKRVRRRIESGE